jgi:hypothetical protein
VIVPPGTRIFDPAIDLSMALSPRTGAIVFWGQSRSGVETLGQLQKRRKMTWLQTGSSSTAGASSANDRRGNEAQWNTKIKIVHNFESQAAFSKTLMQSTVVVDTWAEERAYVAAVEALKMKAPFLIRKESGLVDYLGEEYPLYFVSWTEVQTLLKDKRLVQRKMLEAHTYLKARDASVYSAEHLARQMMNCTINGRYGKVRASQGMAVAPLTYDTSRDGFCLCVVLSARVLLAYIHS